MRYLGGKSRQARNVLEVIRSTREARNVYLEPFLGAGSVFSVVAPSFSKAIGSDCSECLIDLWYRSVFNDWRPNLELTVEEYYNLKSSEIQSAEKAWAGFAASYNGKWFAGYGTTANGATYRNYLDESARSLARKVAALKGHNDITFSAVDYREHSPNANHVVYCDPPYRGTESHYGSPPFDHDEFWRTMDKWSRTSALVLVHEFDAPDGWVPVFSSNRTVTMDWFHDGTKAQESIWVLGSEHTDVYQLRD